ncbi:MAG: class II aldolase/adducin family protein [Mogibacterium sp.]|nr:class II aldolase/adducin family protein [Mogibacterium sp.]
MTTDQGSILLLNAIKGFHGRFKKMYGQISLRLDESTYITTGGNKILSELTEDSFLVCDINTGDLGEIFRRCPKINAFIFGCSADTVKVSGRDSDVPVALEDLAMLTGSTLRIIPDVSPKTIVSLLKETSVALVRDSGAIACGSNLKKAVAGIQIVEKACEAEIHGKMLGGTSAIPAGLAELYKKRFADSYVNSNEEAQAGYTVSFENEFDLRNQLIEYGKELVRRDLSYGSWGNLSVRLNADEMLITPTSMDYFEIKIEDLVKVNIHTLEYERNQRQPSSETRMHAYVYSSFPECGSVIHTHSNGMSVFAACKAGFAIGDPVMHDLIGDVLVTRDEASESQALAEAVAEIFTRTHAAVIPHHGAVFCGPSLDVVFAIAEAVEHKARNLLDF